MNDSRSKYQPQNLQQENNKAEISPDFNASLIRDAKIMMVDDEVLNMKVLQIHLEAEGYSRFLTVSDATKALQITRDELPDVLLLDLSMPGISGFDILEQIKADAKLRYLPVVVLTSSDDAATKLNVLKLGATDFLAKPVDASELALRMRNTLSAVAWRRRISEIDNLTGIPNRVWFAQMLQQRISTFDQGNCNSALIVVNICRFKSINSSLGTKFGDEVLIRFCQRLMDCYRSGEAQQWYSSSRPCLVSTTIARLDADRFAVHMPIGEDRRWQDMLEVTSAKLTDLCDKPLHVSGRSIYISASIGIALLSSSTKSVEELIDNAETAVTYSRSKTGSYYAIYSNEMDAKARELLSLENGLRTAIENNEIFLVFQPKVDTFTGVISGAEALVRWSHPEFGLISPVNFIPLAEDSGMIVSIGEWVLRAACQSARQWQLKGHKDFRIAVNVSIKQLHEINFVDTVDSALRDSGLSPSSLIIELTENMIMDNAEANTVTLQSLKALGVRISVDDFGTGYSSLSYLQRFPLDQLKIDRTFIKEITDSSVHVPIVKAVTSLAHDLDLTVVAEGVETPAQLEYIKKLGCEEYQGYLCSTPIMASEFLDMLEENSRKSA